MSVQSSSQVTLIQPLIKPLIQPTKTKAVQEQKPEEHYVLRLKNKPRVSWTEDTIDNEHMNKKKSNLCCIYHRPGESSSDTCTSDDEGNALQRDRHTKHLHKKKCSKVAKKNKEGNGNIPAKQA